MPAGTPRRQAGKPILVGESMPLLITRSVMSAQRTRLPLHRIPTGRSSDPGHSQRIPPQRRVEQPFDRSRIVRSAGRQKPPVMNRRVDPQALPAVGVYKNTAAFDWILRRRSSLPRHFEPAGVNRVLRSHRRKFASGRAQYPTSLIRSRPL